MPLMTRRTEPYCKSGNVQGDVWIEDAACFALGTKTGRILQMQLLAARTDTVKMPRK